MVERLGGLGEAGLAPLSAALRAGGLPALTPEQRAGLLHGICEQLMDHDHAIHTRMDAAALEASRAKALGRDASGRWVYYFPGGAEGRAGRLFTLSSPWRPKALPKVPHLVKVGERVEVEVEEVKGQIEWRGAEVTQLLGGGKGRFSVIVDGPDGERPRQRPHRPRTPRPRAQRRTDPTP